MYKFLFIILLLVSSCSKPKTVLICGDHVCINNKEANLYFEENLSLEVKIIDNKSKNVIDLVELNLKDANQRKVSIYKKRNKKKVKNLSGKEIKEIKKQISQKKDNKEIKKNDYKKDSKKLNLNFEKNKTYKDKNFENDICKIIDKCNIEEISKYLIKKGKKNNFPDITVRE